jgi:hypothetical protein
MWLNDKVKMWSELCEISGSHGGKSEEQCTVVDVSEVCAASIRVMRPEDRGSKHLRQFGKLLRDYTAQQVNSASSL